MILTILEGRVLEENWGTLEAAYRQGVQQKESGIGQTFLVQNKREKELWRILTIWKSQEALDEMRSSGQTPRGVIFFREAKSEPTLTVWSVENQVTW